MASDLNHSPNETAVASGEPLLLPRVNPVGVLEVPAGYDRRSRPLPGALRLGAGLILGVFALVTVITSAVSLGQYCLTSDGANNQTLPAPYRASSEP